MTKATNRPSARGGRAGLPLVWTSLWLAASTLAACNSTPPTITPAPPSPLAAATGGSRVVDITMPPPVAKRVGTPEPVKIEGLYRVRGPQGEYSMDVPVGWKEVALKPVTGKTDLKFGALFESSNGSGMLSISQFDNGRKPAAIGPTANSLMDMAGWSKQPDFEEISRENVLERPKDAMRLQVRYTRSDGITMHSLVLFQLDGTRFSMVHLGVEESSWRANEGRVRDALLTYHAPALADAGAPSANGAASPTLSPHP